MLYKKQPSYPPNTVYTWPLLVRFNTRMNCTFSCEGAKTCCYLNEANFGKWILSPNSRIFYVAWSSRFKNIEKRHIGGELTCGRLACNLGRIFFTTAG